MDEPTAALTVVTQNVAALAGVPRALADTLRYTRMHMCACTCIDLAEKTSSAP